MQARHVFVTGGTGYLGRPLITGLVGRGHSVIALVRPGSETRVPSGARPVVGDALDARTFTSHVAPADTLVHLVGTPHPNPSKAREFEAIDLRSARAAAEAARIAGVQHFVYVSVAGPAPVMREYIAARRLGEAAVREAGLRATILRPWYVLGPGHRWPYLLVPVYAVLARIPSTADSARRLGLVTRAQMIATLIEAIEHPAAGVRVLEVADIRAAGRSARSRATAYAAPPA